MDDVEALVLLGAVVEAAAEQLFAVERDPVELGGEQSEVREAVGQFGEPGVVALDLGAYQGPELVLGYAELVGGQRGEEPEVTGEHRAEQGVRQLAGRPAQQQGVRACGEGFVLGVAAGQQIDVLGEVLDRDADRPVGGVVEDHGVLAVRAVGHPVAVQVVEQSGEEGREEPFEPGAGRQSGAVHQFGHQGASVGADLEQGGHGAGPLTVAQHPGDGLPPYGAEQFVVAVRGVLDGVVQRVAHGDAG